jgi:hypothetical protein
MSPQMAPNNVAEDEYDDEHEEEEEEEANITPCENDKIFVAGDFVWILRGMKYYTLTGEFHAYKIGDDEETDGETDDEETDEDQ